MFSTREASMSRFVRPVHVLFATLLFLASCDATDDMLEPTHGVQATHLDTANIDVPATDGGEYTLVEADIKFSKLFASRWIDRSGGSVVLEGISRDGTQKVMHVLIVPKGAVQKKTLFTMHVASSHHIKIDLRAQAERKVKGVTELVDVGHLGFRTPVMVALDHSLATNVTDPTELTLMYDPENGRPWEPKGGTLVEGYENWLVTYLDHFSKYAVALDRKGNNNND
jgi:hypothetical protein